MREHLIKMHAKYGLHICGEGGEFETFVLDCPRFRQRIRLLESRTVLHSDNCIAPVAYLKMDKLELVEKNERGAEDGKEERELVATESDVPVA
jgi:diphthine-ammonia ligase